MFNIKDIVKDNTVQFAFYKNGIFYYNVFHDEQLYLFPVPLSDIGDGVLKSKDKAILFMRYIRKAIEEKTFVNT